jgi:hypothetical protein
MTPTRPRTGRTSWIRARSRRASHRTRPPAVDVADVFAVPFDQIAPIVDALVAVLDPDVDRLAKAGARENAGQPPGDVHDRSR